MLLLSIAIRINQFLGFQKPYVLPVLLNAFQVTAVMYCIYKLLQKHNKRNYSFILPWAGMGFVAFFLPVIGHTQSVYTDAMSFSFSITAYYAWVKADQSAKKNKKFFWLCLSGFIGGVGASIKITVLIFFIALFCYLVLSGKWKRKWKEFALAGIIIVMVLLITQGIAKCQPCQELRDSHGLPGTYWIGIGILGNGGYSDNQEYSIRLKEIWGMKEKEEFSREYIRENLGNFLDFEHICAKVKYNFASGNLGSSDFMRKTENANFFFECISIYGKYFWRFSMINTSLFYGMLFLILAGVLSEWREIRKGAEPNELQAVTIFTIIGLGIYLMIFEANNRQLYNHYSWFVIGAVLGIDAALRQICIWKTTLCALLPGDAEPE